jgi:dTDP-glucose pyrophosphorylase
MAFIIPMLGRSSRFFDEGYKLPKYQLEINKMTSFAYAISSFKRYFSADLFIFLVRSDYEAYEFVNNEVLISGIKNYKIKVVDYETEGQADTVSLSLEYMDNNEPIYIFNIDTYRDNYIKPDFVNICDGYLEVFKGNGDAWSFVLPSGQNRVIRTTEKDRISNLCSDGLYFFRNKKIYMNAFNSAKSNNKMVNDEYYIAPIYNELIRLGMDIRYDLIDINVLKFFGEPKEYQDLISIK